jgi:hypothetical protein
MEELNLEIGIWTIHSDGITCRQPQNILSHAGIGEIWAKRLIKTKPVWDLPIHFTTKDWITEENIINLVQAMAIYRKFYPRPDQGLNFSDVDENTTSFAMKTIRNRENE